MEQIPARGIGHPHNRIGTRAIASVALATLALIGATASAQASGPAAGSGGISGGGGGGIAPASDPPLAPGCLDTQLGKRDLKVGDCGVDVETLNWILKAKDFGAPALTDEFDDPTAQAVSEFQGTADLRANGVFDSTTASALFQSMPAQLATWYGPGLFGNQTACGQTLTPRTVGVAHKTLPCGSKVVIRYRGRFVRTTVIDRGPFANGASWDLTQATARSLHFTTTDTIRVAKLATSTKPSVGRSAPR
jgi:peptidoglycan hydrolase-like protein with peptidoglycan-binding domain